MPIRADETTALLSYSRDEPEAFHARPVMLAKRRDSLGIVTLFAVITFALFWLITFHGRTSDVGPSKTLPTDPLERARRLLELSPLIDGHIDLPIVARNGFRNQLGDIHLDEADFPQHVNIPALREGRVGGFFWSAYVPCAQVEGANYTSATWRKINVSTVAKLLIKHFSHTFDLITSANGIRAAFRNRKIASLISIEGYSGHIITAGTDLNRLYWAEGISSVIHFRSCDNIMTWVFDALVLLTPATTLLQVREMNRIGMIVDLSHASPATALDVLKWSLAPVIFSHSNARAIWNHTRNIPDEVLDRIRRGVTCQDVLVMVNFVPEFVGESVDGAGKHSALKGVADHIEYLGEKIGREHLGLGSDFDGFPGTANGLEDVSKYPDLMAELISRGWSDEEIVGIAGANFIRVFEKVGQTAEAMRDTAPATSIYNRREDL
ncbi:MAG: hypothetical protein CYPHOPRED_002875 [Cyphobasidiales sp. Tagirdzhanova-0007]|nr:MAG: hypothetical protein CYPHOPRED_002875 [Cyphobasidiales sp. Tagirdzhanova-0007]